MGEQGGREDHRGQQTGDRLLPPGSLLDPDPACDLNYVPNQAIHTEVDLVLSNSLGFGGHNACIAFRKVTR